MLAAELPKAEIRAQVSRRRASHPSPLSGPDVTVSRHPARSRVGGERDELPLGQQAGLVLADLLQPGHRLVYLPQNRLNLCMAHGVRCR
jgi:hypothetical protein